jgi:hypothetical protein
MLLLYVEPVEPVEGDPYRPPWLALLPRQAKKQARSLYTGAQIRDALNTFLDLIVVMCHSDQPFSLNCIGSNPLGHAFGTGRIKCRDVHTMERFLEALASNLMSGGAKQLLEIAARPCRRRSVGVDCAPLVRNQDSIFWSAPLVMAKSLLVRAVTPPIPMELLYPDHFPARAWGQLWRIPELVCLQDEPFASSPNIHSGQKQLSSDPIFLGLTKSLRSTHMIQSPSKMGRELDVDLNRVWREFDRFYAQKLQVGDIGARFP